MELLQTCGLLPRDLGLLHIERLRPAERIPSGLELQRRLEAIIIRPDETISPAEPDWLYGDGAAAEVAARDAEHRWKRGREIEAAVEARRRRDGKRG